MPPLIAPNKIYLTNSKIAGRGVFAKVPIKEGETIEVAPVIVIPYEQAYKLWNELYRYVFSWGYRDNRTVALAMGYGSFYNQSENPNATYQKSVLNRTFSFIALRDINKDEEITISYGYKIPKDYLRKY